MKKTMFITSVIMVVVMAIALTTSSLAWFNATGSPTVTTNALQLQAASVASSGLQISTSGPSTGWGDRVDLAGDTTDLQPMMPVINKEFIAFDAESVVEGYEASYCASLSTLFNTPDNTNELIIDWVNQDNGDADAPADKAAAATYVANKFAELKKAQLIEALANPASSGDGVGLITQKIAQNGIYAYVNGTSGASVTPGRTGFFTDDLWITNTASGAAGDGIIGRDVYVQPTIKFYSTYVGVGAEGNEEYVASSRNPDLFVAVLADSADTTVTQYRHTTGSGDQAVVTWNSESEGADVDNEEHPITREYNEETWEIVDIFHSNTTKSANVKIGNTVASFASGQSIASSYTTDTTVASLQANSGKTSAKLAKAANNEAFGKAKQFRIVAWYDGDTLDNNNSGFAVYFELTFSASAN